MRILKSAERFGGLPMLAAIRPSSPSINGNRSFAIAVFAAAIQHGVSISVIAARYSQVRIRGPRQLIYGGRL
jgi:hypothetical protein